MVELVIHSLVNIAYDRSLERNHIDLILILFFAGFYFLLERKLEKCIFPDLGYILNPIESLRSVVM